MTNIILFKDGKAEVSPDMAKRLQLHPSNNQKSAFPVTPDQCLSPEEAHKKTAKLKLHLKSDTGFSSKSECSISTNMWREINMIIENGPVIDEAMNLLAEFVRFTDGNCKEVPTMKMSELESKARTLVFKFR